MCVSVCLSVCPLAYLKDHTPNYYEIFCTCEPCMVVRSFPDDSVIRYLLPVLWMTSHLPINGEANAMPIEGMLKVTQRVKQHPGGNV